MKRACVIRQAICHTQRRHSYTHVSIRMTDLMSVSTAGAQYCHACAWGRKNDHCAPSRQHPGGISMHTQLCSVTQSYVLLSVCSFCSPPVCCGLSPLSAV